MTCVHAAAGGPAEVGVPLSPPHMAPSTASQDTGCPTLPATAPCSRAPRGHPGLPPKPGGIHGRQGCGAAGVRAEALDMQLAGRWMWGGWLNRGEG